MFERILVPLDGSRAAETAIPYLEEICNKLSSEITLTSVSDSHTADLDRLYCSYLEGIKAEVQDKLECSVGEQAKVSWKTLQGKPADEILHYADMIDANLIVMANRGSSGQGPWLLGNIAAKVLRATNKPLLLVRVPVKGADVRQKRTIRKILVPLDGSELGAASIPYAEMLAKGLDAELILLQVVQPIAAMPYTGGDASYYMQYDDNVKTSDPNYHSTLERIKASTIVYLNGFAASMKNRGLKVSSAVTLGYPPDQIIDYAKENAIDLIAMSSHGRTGIRRWVFGSVTDKVLHVSDTAVLLIRATKT